MTSYTTARCSALVYDGQVCVGKKSSGHRCALVGGLGHEDLGYTRGVPI